MSAVVGVPHEEWGESVHAEVMLKEGAEVEEAELGLAGAFEQKLTVSPSRTHLKP